MLAGHFVQELGLSQCTNQVVLSLSFLLEELSRSFRSNFVTVPRSHSDSVLSQTSAYPDIDRNSQLGQPGNPDKWEALHFPYHTILPDYSISFILHSKPSTPGTHNLTILSYDFFREFDISDLRPSFLLSIPKRNGWYAVRPQKYPGNPPFVIVPKRASVSCSSSSTGHASFSVARFLAARSQIRGCR